MTTATVFCCKPCNIIYYHGFWRLPQVSDDNTQRFQYDMDFTKYKYFPVLPLTYLSLEFVKSLDAKFANKAVSFLALGTEFNQRQSILDQRRCSRSSPTVSIRISCIAPYQEKYSQLQSKFDTPECGSSSYFRVWSSV
jgi:hypothetical protein